MKRILIAAAAATLCSASAFAADVGVSVSIGQPGFYGRLDIGGYPPPALIYREPVLVDRVYVDRPPVYLRVPPGHAKHWREYCHEYHACGERVYFVRDDWYSREYVPRYRERHGHHEDRWDEHHHGGPDHDRGRHGKGHD